MPYKKRVKKDTSDKRPEQLRDGKVNEIIGATLSGVQDELNISNDTMAEILDCSSTLYDKIIAGTNGLTTDKLTRLYYTLGVDLNHLVGNDNKYPALRADDVSDPDNMSFKALLKAIIKDIENTDGHDNRVDKILDVYNSFGELMKILLSRDKR